MRQFDDAYDQLDPFLTSLFKAVEGAPNAALVYTLAIGKDGRATDAYTAGEPVYRRPDGRSRERLRAQGHAAQPHGRRQTAQVLRRRLFETIDDSRAASVIAALPGALNAAGEALSGDAAAPRLPRRSLRATPCHPEVLRTLTGKTATLGNFQRVRGMLRLLARTIAHLWQQQPADATAIHLHHIDPGYEPIRQEIVTRLGQTAYLPAIANDVAGTDKRALAEEIDAEHHRGLPPYATYVARTIFMHTLGLQRPAEGPISPSTALLGAGSNHGYELHRGGAAEIRRRIGLSR